MFFDNESIMRDESSWLDFWVDILHCLYSYFVKTKDSEAENHPAKQHKANFTMKEIKVTSNALKEGLLCWENWSKYMLPNTI